MAEYIKREAVKEAIGFVHLHCVAYGENKSLLDVINEVPAADVEPVKHGWWLPQILLGERVWNCSECKTIGSPVWKRCPVCEAKMDGDNNEE